MSSILSLFHIGYRDRRREAVIIVLLMIEMLFALSGLGQARGSNSSINSAPVLAENNQPQLRAGSRTEPTISVTQLTVPIKAQLELDKSAKEYKRGERAEAMASVNRALDLYPKFAKALAWRGVLKSEDEALLPEACADLKSAVELDPLLASGFSALGTIYNSMGRWDDARAVLKRALKIEPRLWQAEYELARADAAQANIASALKHIDAAISLGGDTMQAAALRAAILSADMQDRQGN